jgi:hypothetical protein
MATVTQPLLEDNPEQPETAVSVPVTDSPAMMFERLARDPNASVENIERLMALWERSEARKAEALFNTAMSEAQAEMRPVAADATNPQTRSRYASYSALDHALRPIYTKHGFGVSFPGTADSPIPEHVRVLCKVTHKGGHVERYHLDMPADGKGAKGGDVMTKTHATGSALSYGQRYLLKGIFNVAVGEDDDDGNRAAKPAPEEKAPDGYEPWLATLDGVASEGMATFSTAWNKSNPAFRQFLARTAPKHLESIKAKAAKVKAK